MQQEVTNNNQSALKFDKEFQIATANVRTAVTWKNKTTTIKDFVDRLSKTLRTNETLSEYLKMPKGDQDNIKDVGSFVGGILKGGRRRKQDVANRHIITLDLDYARKGQVDEISDKLRGICHTIYSTHKHTPDKPRLRVIVYPDRVLLPDEYQAVSRKLAAKLDIETVDDSTHDINRLFYWPSTSSDGEFVFRHNDAPFCPVDKALASYGEGDLWRDAALWSYSSRETVHVDRLLKKQADPIEKQNVIGAFCRSFTIKQAIETYLKDVYRPESTGRYTYINGSTSNGVVIYDNKFAYSNHSTDPAHGQLCNAFDLVRIHKFGNMDDDATPGTPTHRLPSFREMEDMARKISSVKIDIIKHKIGISEEDFESFGGQWMDDLEETAQGVVKASWHNFSLIAQNDPEIKHRMKLNRFTERVETADGSLWTDFHSSEVKKYLGETYHLDMPASKFDEVINYYAELNAYHPIRDYLESLKWDGKKRIETLFIDYLGSPDNIYTRETALCWFSAAVHRVFEPGCKFDYVIVLGGEQGVLKTTFVMELAKGIWFGALSSFDPKIAMEEITGKWIIEIAELAATTKNELEQQKSFLSAQSTTTRMAYARRAQEFKRQCVFMGTTNSKEYLKDSTGNRRWWPMDVNIPDKIDVERLRCEIDQIWAEAYETLYIYGRRMYLTDEAEAIAKQVQAEKMVEDEWMGIIEEWLDREADVDRYEINSPFGGGMEKRDRCCIIEIWNDCFGYRHEPRQHDRRRISACMSQIPGWKSVSRIRFGQKYGRQRGWLKKTEIPF